LVLYFLSQEVVARFAKVVHPEVRPLLAGLSSQAVRYQQNFGTLRVIGQTQKVRKSDDTTIRDDHRKRRPPLESLEDGNIKPGAPVGPPPIYI
jgi:hypothetical protein